MSMPNPPALVPMTQVRCEVGALVSLGAAKYGERRYVPLGGGTVRGPELNGTLVRISADVSEDTKTGARFYTIRLDVSPEEVARLGAIKLVPGMPVEALIQTSPRTVMSYLIKPLHDQLSRAFREK